MYIRLLWDCVDAHGSGQPYPIHPLDLTDMKTKVGADGVTYTVCVGSITNGGSMSSGTTDAMFGDSFLRNVYTM